MSLRLSHKIISTLTMLLAANATISLLGCGRQHSSSSESIEQVMRRQSVKPDGGPSDFAGFSVDVTFSEKAKKKLTESKETVVVISYFTGSPKQGAPLKQYKQYLSRPGPIGLGEVEVEVAPGESAKFGEIKLKEDALAQTDKQGPQLLIKVVSGRKSSEDNLLNCDLYEGALKPIQGKVIPIACKLIRE